MKKLKQLFFLSFILSSVFLIESCSNDDNSSAEDETVTYELPEIDEQSSSEGYFIIKKQVPYVKIPVTNDVSKLLYDKDEKDVNTKQLKDTVLVYIQGGPIHLINYGGMLSFLDNYVQESVSKNYSFVEIRQYHDYNPTVFGSGTTFTDQIAEYSNLQTLDMIEKTVKSLKSIDKIVYLLGHSNGSFMVQDYINNNKTSADGYLIAGTRIKKVQAFFDYYPKDKDITFTNGTDVTVKDVPTDEIPYFNVVRKLQLNHFKDYTSLLLSKSTQFPKMYYAFGGQDINLGKIEQDEFDFLNNNKINYSYNEYYDHSWTIIDVLDNGMKYFRTLK